MLEKLKEKLKSKFEELKEDTQRKSELKKLEKEAYYNAKKESLQDFANKKVAVEEKITLKDIKEKPKGQSNWDFFGGIDKMNKEMAGNNKKMKPEKDINEKLKEML